jgi:hypothetical protein
VSTKPKFRGEDTGCCTGCGRIMRINKSGSIGDLTIAVLPRHVNKLTGKLCEGIYKPAMAEGVADCHTCSRTAVRLYKVGELGVKREDETLSGLLWEHGNIEGIYSSEWIWDKSNLLSCFAYFIRL